MPCEDLEQDKGFGGAGRLLQPELGLIRTNPGCDPLSQGFPPHGPTPAGRFRQQKAATTAVAAGFKSDLQLRGEKGGAPTIPASINSKVPASLMKDGERGRFYPAPDLGRALILKKSFRVVPNRGAKGLLDPNSPAEGGKGEDPSPIFLQKTTNPRSPLSLTNLFLHQTRGLRSELRERPA